MRRTSRLNHIKVCPLSMTCLSIDIFDVYRLLYSSPGRPDPPIQIPNTNGPPSASLSQSIPSLFPCCKRRGPSEKGTAAVAASMVELWSCFPGGSELPASPTSIRIHPLFPTPIVGLAFYTGREGCAPHPYDFNVLYRRIPHAPSLSLLIEDRPPSPNMRRHGFSKRQQVCFRRGPSQARAPLSSSHLVLIVVSGCYATYSMSQRPCLRERVVSRKLTNLNRISPVLPAHLVVHDVPLSDPNAPLTLIPRLW
jgi:hypothetical protein